MARPLRIGHEEAVYHATSRENARYKIFSDDRDKEKFLETLDSVIKRYNWLCHAYCLMDKHYHQRYIGRLSLKEIFKQEMIKDKTRRNREICAVHLKFGYTLKEIADSLRIHYTTASKAIKGEKNRK